MFAHLDRNSNGVLDSEEVFDMKHVTGEPCMGPFLEKCNRTGGLLPVLVEVDVGRSVDAIAGKEKGKSLLNR
ncbi:unnamed protein product [Cyprideis torosa]|uniref:Uncharacterized protein n=1 Tax=Cyprideis torosa TaxID=163714 RepID=A0A7R8WAK1_9CRUS|nr:unnamed protein product [Cyprideis torosa]CAG0891101.1 unnamed protein product [Cyprideis torosa]